MAAPKKEKAISTGNLTYEEVLKAIKGLKGSPSIVGNDEIMEHCLVERYITDIPTLDFLGGVTKSRVNLFVGPKSSSKSTSCYLLLAKHTREIKESGRVKFVLVWATEGFDSAYAKALGVDLDYVIIKQTKILEEGLSECENIIRMGVIEAMLWDSMDMTVPRKIQDNDYEATRGSVAGANSDHLPRFYNCLLEFGVTSYWIKQARVKQGFTGGAEVLVMNGGKILEHIPDNIYFFKRMSNYNLTYTPVNIKCEKARSTKIGTVLELPLSDLGFDKVRDIVSVAFLVGHIVKGGAGWSTFEVNGKEYKLQGQENIITFLKENSDVLKGFWKDVYDKYILNNPGIVFSSSLTMDTDLFGEDQDNEQAAN